MRRNPPVSIIIVNYNGASLLRDCLESIAESAGAGGAAGAGGEEIIVVDNASTDGSPEYVLAEFPHVKVLRMRRNLGFAEANNRGAEAAGGEYLAFLNNDTVVTPGWLDPLLEVLKDSPSVGVVGGKLLLFGSDGKINSAGADIIVNGGAYDIGFMEEDSGKFNVRGPRGAVCAASMMVRRDEFLSLGGFDPRYFMFFEDVDLCWRYWLRGYRVQYEPRSVVYHRFGSSAGADLRSPFRVFHGTRNILLNVLKNYEPPNLLKALALNAAIHAATFFAYFLWLRPRSALAVLRAYAHALWLMPSVMRARKAVQKNRTVPDRYMFDNSLVVSLGVARREYMRVRKVLARKSRKR
jgi:GT2 family glycosyltransferase